MSPRELSKGICCHTCTSCAHSPHLWDPTKPIVSSSSRVIMFMKVGENAQCVSVQFSQTSKTPTSKLRSHL